ncbi:MAG: hypothetical protein Q9217_001827 [Psora testacea]
MVQAQMGKSRLQDPTERHNLHDLVSIGDSLVIFERRDKGSPDSTVFEQLDTTAEQWPSQIKVILQKPSTTPFFQDGRADNMRFGTGGYEENCRVATDISPTRRSTWLPRDPND